MELSQGCGSSGQVLASHCLSMQIETASVVKTRRWSCSRGQVNLIQETASVVFKHGEPRLVESWNPCGTHVGETQAALSNMHAKFVQTTYTTCNIHAQCKQTYIQNTCQTHSRTNPYTRIQNARGGSLNSSASFLRPDMVKISEPNQKHFREIKGLDTK